MYRILAAAATNDLTTLATVKRELELSDGDSPSPQDERLADLISTASDLVSQYCNRDTFGLQTIEQTEYIRQPDHGIVLAGDINPVIGSVTLNGTTLDADHYVLDGSILHRAYPNEGGWGWSGGSTSFGWSRGHGWPCGKVVITYTSGFELLDGLPRAIERACLDVVFSLYASSTRDQTIRSEAVEGVGSIAYATAGSGALPIASDRLAALDRYRRLAGF